MTKQNTRNKKSLIVLIIAIITICFTGIFSSANAQSVRSRIKVEYLRKPDNSKALTAKLLLRQGRKYVPAANFPVTYSVLKNDEELELGTATTDENGEALFIISADYQLPVNEDNFTVLSAAFAGNDTCRSSSSDVEVKDITVQVDVGNNESKTITVSLSEKDNEGNVIPVAEEYVTLSIERLFSLLPIGDGSTDSLGVFEFVYEDEIPGDAEGNINVIVKLEESELYGTVETAQKANWGTPVDYSVDVSARALWSDQAPLWMLIATFIVLAGAWFNFGLAVLNLLKMKKAGK